MKTSIPDVEMLDRAVNTINVKTPENSELSGISLDFAIRFTTVKDEKFSVVLGVNVTELKDGENVGDPFMSAEIVGQFKVSKDSASSLEHFIAINMLYPELRLLCVRMLEYMKVDASEFPLSVPSSALENGRSEPD